LQEVKNEVIHNPRTAGLWLPRGILDGLAIILIRNWLASNLNLGILVTLIAAISLSFLVAVLYSYSKLFSSRRSSFLLVAPIPFSDYLLEKTAEIVAPNIELVFLLGVPVLLVGKLPLGLALLVLVTIVLGILAASFLAVMVALFLAHWLFSKKLLILAGFFALASTVLVSIFARLETIRLDLVKLNVFRISSSVLLVESVVAIGFLILTVNTPPLLEKIYSNNRSKVLEARLMTKGGWHSRAQFNLFSYAKGSVSDIFIKEVILSLRNPMIWLRFILVLTFFALYPILKLKLAVDRNFFFALAFNVGFATLLVHIFMNEVVINTFISETRRLALMLTAPIATKEIVFSKFIGSLCLSLPLSILGVAAFSAWAKMGWLHLGLSVFLIIFINIGVVGTLVGLGASNTDLNRDISTYLDQFMVEQVFITSPKSVLILMAGTLVLLADLGLLFLAYYFIAIKLAGSLKTFALVTPVLIVFNFMTAFTSLHLGEKWL
jgi:hypothetical protein